MSESMELAKEVIARCRQLATFSEDKTGTRRTFLSPPDAGLPSRAWGMGSTARSGGEN